MVCDNHSLLKIYGIYNLIYNKYNNTHLRNQKLLIRVPGLIGHYSAFRKIKE